MVGNVISDIFGLFFNFPSFSVPSFEVVFEMHSVFDYMGITHFQIIILQPDLFTQVFFINVHRSYMFFDDFFEVVEILAIY